MRNTTTNFDDFAPDYRKIHTENICKIGGTDSSYFGEYKVKIISANENNNKKVSILDLGCGDGMNAAFFSKYFRYMEYQGIDISKESINLAQNFKSRNICFSTYDGKHIPFKSQTFDIIFLACVLHHVPHIEHFNLLSECSRALKTGGHLYIFEHNPVNPVTRKLVNDCPFDKDAVLIKPKKLKNILLSLNYKRITTSYTIFLPRKEISTNLLWIENHIKWLPLGGQYYIRCEK